MSDQSNQSEKQLERISMRSIWNDFVSMLNFEKGAMHTFKGLLLHPRKTIDEYLYTNRSKHAHPMRLLLFSTAISTVFIFYITKAEMTAPGLDTTHHAAIEINESIDKSKSGNVEIREKQDTTFEVSTSDLASMPSDSTNFNPLPQNTKDSLMVLIDNLKHAPYSEGIKFGNENKKLLKRDRELTDTLTSVIKPKIMQEVVSKMMSFTDKFIFLLVPFYALGTFLFFRKKSRYNFAENLVVNAYVLSFQNAITILGIPFMLFFSIPSVTAVASILAILFTFYLWIEVYQLNGFRGFVKTGMVFVFSYLFYIIAILLILRFYILKDLFESTFI